MDNFPDQSHIDRVREALWNSNGSGASVMVGSGFSRLATKEMPTLPDLPLWREVATAIAGRLYPEQEDPSVAAVDRVLGLAQEYETAFGRTNLHRFLKEMIQDENYSPSNEHSRLLSLPWCDIFTTNWDTLLERSRLSVTDHSYSVVTDMDEIPLASKPRIVKLHGSLPAQFPLILTEEDYRTYPMRFAPFVNTVQQAMMETVFCLLGFSGTDPNFLNWSGWVRDNLGASAPRIYLAGRLALSPHRRRMLEGRGVVPIDLAHHPRAPEWPEHQRHQYAIHWILHTLERGRPYDVTYWPSPFRHPYPAIPDELQPVVDNTGQRPMQEFPAGSDLGNDDLRSEALAILSVWEHNRQNYPGWLFLPVGEERESFKRNTINWERTLIQVLPELTRLEQLRTLRELAWRSEILLEPLSPDFASAAEVALQSIDCEQHTIDGIAHSEVDWTIIRESWCIVALSLLTKARLHLESDQFSQWLEATQRFADDDLETHHRIQHEKALWAVYSLDFELLLHLLDDWHVEEGDPFWMIRKAALLRDIDYDDEAIHLVARALDRVRRATSEEQSVIRLSREGWAMWSSIMMDNRQEHLRRWNQLAALKCDALTEKDIILQQISGDDESQDAPGFDLGIRQVRRIHFTTEDPQSVRFRAAYRALRVSEVAGLPKATTRRGRLGYDVAASLWKRCGESIVASNPELSARLAIRSCTDDGDKALQYIFSRPHVALMSMSSILRLVEDCTRLIDFALRQGWIERCRVALEVLSRLVIRLHPEEALKVFQHALDIYSTVDYELVSHPWMVRPLDNLLKRSWATLLPQQRQRMSLSILSAPVAGLDGFQISADSRFPDPGELLNGDSSFSLPTRTTENELRWLYTIRFLIRGLGASTVARERSATRILRITSESRLNDNELTEVASALWSGDYTPDDGLPIGTKLYDWVFLVLPEPSAGLAERRFRQKWMSIKTESLRDEGVSQGNVVTVVFGSDPTNPEKVEDILLNIGLALSALPAKGNPFTLEDSDSTYICDLIEAWISIDSTRPSIMPFAILGEDRTQAAVEGITHILKKLVIPQSLADSLYEHLKGLTASGIPAFQPVHGLVELRPGRLDDMLAWLRMGLASNDDALARDAMMALHFWLTNSSLPEGRLRNAPPLDLIGEIGSTIASRRWTNLTGALELARWIFDSGTSAHQAAIRQPALDGLSYLAEELQYVYGQKHLASRNIPLVRFRCAQLVVSMAMHGIRDAAAIRVWLNLIENDPLPELRNLLDSLSDEAK